MSSHGTPEVEAKRLQHLKRGWNSQSNTHQDAKIRRIGESMEKIKDDPNIKSVLRKVVAAQRATADGAQKRARTDCRTEIVVPISREKVSTDMIKPQSSLTIVTRQDAAMSTSHPQPQSNNISGATSSKLSIKALLNESTSPARPTQPLTSSPPKTTSSRPQGTGTSLGNGQDNMSDGIPSDTKSSIFARSSTIMPPPENSVYHDHASRASGPVLALASHFKSASRRRSDKPLLDGEAVAQRLAQKGILLLPQGNTPGLWVTLPIGTLLSRDLPSFFNMYSQVTGTGKVAILSVGLLDMSWKRPQIGNISLIDPDAFYALKRTVWNCFCMFLMTHLESTSFRVTVAAPTMPDDTMTSSRRLGNETKWGRVSEPSTRHGHQNLAATSNTEPIHLPPSASQASAARSSYNKRAVHGEQERIPQRGADLPTEKKHPPAEILALTTSKCRSPYHVPRRASQGEQPASQAAAAPQDCHPPPIPVRTTHNQDKPINEASSAVRVAVFIQENENGQLSRLYSRNNLFSEITSVDFFAWFARYSGYTDLSGPAKLKFTLKDALPTPVHSKISKGDEERFKHMKQGIKQYLEQAKALMPELMEFAILVTVPGWVVERRGNE